MTYEPLFTVSISMAHFVQVVSPERQRHRRAYCARGHPIGCSPSGAIIRGRPPVCPDRVPPFGCSRARGGCPSPIGEVIASPSGALVGGLSFRCHRLGAIVGGTWPPVDARCAATRRDALAARRRFGGARNLQALSDGPAGAPIAGLWWRSSASKRTTLPLAWRACPWPRGTGPPLYRRSNACWRTGPQVGRKISMPKSN